MMCESTTNSSCTIMITIFIMLVLFPVIALTAATQEPIQPKTDTNSSHKPYNDIVSKTTTAAAISTTNTTTTNTTTTTTTTTAAASMISTICMTTLYPTVCESALAGEAAAGKPATSRNLFDISVESAIARARSARAMAYNLSGAAAGRGKPPPTGMDDCVELLDISLDQLADVLRPRAGSTPHDERTWLSAALTNQETCAESIAAALDTSAGPEAVAALVRSLTQFVSVSLALHVKLAGPGGGTHRRKLLPSAGSSRFPAWLPAGDRKLLEASPGDARADAVVAKDGSGTHATIGEAIEYVTSLAAAAAAAGGGGSGRSVIYVKAGTYEEYIKITNKQKNIMLMGDGKGKSVIVGHRSVGDGWTTYASATVAAVGEGFMAKGLSIINNAGPAKHQAVALRVGADKSVIYQCSIQGYQDTLYAHSNRQFYAETDVYGTVDFIFGNSAVVLQNCYIQPRKPAGGQKNTVTAQGRTDPNQNTGISIHKCRIIGSSDLGGTPTYLGRPWQKYSRTAVMASYLDGSIDKAGWDRWSGNFALDTLYYGEYGNSGPGAATSGRVRWAGVHPSMSSSEASQFTVANFIFGDSWLPETGVSYISGL